ncbi:MAG: BatB protein [Desulfobacteraceae bacterium 4572_35.1]|nr:MAG: BatB protein [Desulfobacteraceae bacterium 4572_35.1]
MIHFAWPWIFIMLPLPYIVYRWMPLANKEQSPALWVPSLKPFNNATSAAPTTTRQWWKLALALLCWLLIVGAAARPQWLGQSVELPVVGRDLMMAVDLSGSMQIEDFQLNGNQIDRLTALKAVALSFIQQREGDRIGLILFGDQPYIQAPLTFDHATVMRLLQEAQIGLAGKSTAIGDAIGLAIKRLSHNKDNQKVLILLTDGVNNSGQLTPEKAAELAKKVGLKIYTIGIGADSMEVGSFIFKHTVNPSADLDEKTLKMLADTSGGKYFRAHDTSELADIYQQLDRMEPVEKDKNIYHPITDLYHWPLALATLLCLLWFILHQIQLYAGKSHE